MSLFSELESVMPHRPPALLLTRVEEVSSSGVRALAEVCAGMPFVGEDGLLDSVAYMEMMAQCFAAGSGCARLAEGQEQPLWGYLAAVKDFTVHAPSRVGDSLSVATWLSVTLGPITVIEGSVHRGAELMATGQFKLFVPQEAAV